MSILKVARMGHPVLRRKTPPLDPADVISPAVQQLIDHMFETMHEYVGIGLAAPQVHESLRLFVAGTDDPDGGLPPVVMMINPKIEPLGLAEDEDWEECRSIPDVRGRVPRAVEIRVRCLDRHGRPQNLTARGFAARVIWHETDHLERRAVPRPHAFVRQPDLPHRVRPLLAQGRRVRPVMATETS